MTYQYERDGQQVGTLTLGKDEYEIVQECYNLIKSELEKWNQISLKHGAITPPYENEVNDLETMIEWGDAELEKLNDRFGFIRVRGISIGSLRYLKAALLYGIKIKEKIISEKRQQNWPETALKFLEPPINKIKKILENINYPPSGFYNELFPDEKSKSNIEWDVFISHASEDKESIAKPLAESLIKKNIKVWYDEFTLKLGDSLRRTIDKGLTNSKYGAVILSKNFFSKEWPQKELDALVAKEINGIKVILPIWHHITKEEVLRFSPILADKLSISTDEGLEKVVTKIIEAIK